MGSQNSAQPIETVIRNARVRDAAFHYRVVEKVYQGRCALTAFA